MATKAEIQQAAYRAEATSERAEGVTERRPPEPGGGGNATGLRTERVTLEITHSVPVAKWDWTNILETYRPGESVRVVEEAHFDDLAQVAMERDAAIRERDTLRAERITQALTADRFAAAVAEADRLRARVAELESAAKLARAANADGGSNHAAPAASGAAVLAEIAAAFGCEPDDDADLVEAATLLVRERDTAVAKAASGNGVSGSQPISDAGKSAIEKTQAASGAAGTGWLTADERGSIQHAANLAKAGWSYSVAQELENILARSSPPEVVLPLWWKVEVAEIRKALAAAGVTVKEVGA